MTTKERPTATLSVVRRASESEERRGPTCLVSWSSPSPESVREKETTSLPLVTGWRKESDSRVLVLTGSHLRDVPSDRTTARVRSGFSVRRFLRQSYPEETPLGLKFVVPPLPPGSGGYPSRRSGRPGRGEWGPAKVSLRSVERPVYPGSTGQVCRRRNRPRTSSIFT